MKLDPSKTAVLTLDFQNGIFGFASGSEAIVPNAKKIVDWARKNSVKVIHVGLGFREGHPEISNNPVFAQVKQNNLFVKGTPSAQFHADLVHPEDLVVYKHRVSAFSENELDLILRTGGYAHLILMGIATSGIVLSTIRRAFDLDYQCTVISDACFDRDPEVHRVLTEKVFTHQGKVFTSEAFLNEQVG